ncbi:hypothetical protein [Thiomonas sp.]
MAHKILAWLHLLDWAAAVASLGLGVYWMSWWWIGFGLIAVPLAWWDPGKHLHGWLLSRFLRKSARRQPSRMKQGPESAAPLGFPRAQTPWRPVPRPYPSYLVWHVPHSHLPYGN